MLLLLKPKHCRFEDDPPKSDPPPTPDEDNRWTEWGANDPLWKGGNTEPIPAQKPDPETDPLLPAVKPDEPSP